MGRKKQQLCFARRGVQQVEATEPHEALCISYDALVNEVAGFKSKAKVWSASTVTAGSAQLQAKVAQLEKFHTDMEEFITEANELVVNAKKLKAAEDKEESKKRERALKSFALEGLQTVWLRLMWEVQMVTAREDNSASSENPLGSLVVDDSLVPAAAEAAPAPVVPYRPTIPQVGTNAPRHLPWTVKPGVETSGAAVLKATDALNTERVNTYVAQSIGYYAKHRSSGAVKRMPPKGAGAGGDTFESLKWVPEPWVRLELVPEALREHGSPWLLSTKAAGARFMNSGIPCPGIGHFLIVVTGTVIVITWPMKAVLEMGCEPNGAWGFFPDHGGQRLWGLGQSKRCARQAAERRSCLDPLWVTDNNDYRRGGSIRDSVHPVHDRAALHRLQGSQGGDPVELEPRPQSHGFQPEALGHHWQQLH